MKRFIEGECRTQTTLLPESIDDYITNTNPVRIVDVFVDELDLGKLGFDGVEPAATGRPAYHPAILLKIYIYGYLNRIQSSRRLEKEAQRNVELMWLTERLTPDFKTIARFRQENGKAIRSVCRQFVVLCQQLGLFSESLVATTAVNSKPSIIETEIPPALSYSDAWKKLNRASIGISLHSIPLTGKSLQLLKLLPSVCIIKIAALKEQMKSLKDIEVQLNKTPDKQISLTDPDARSMKTRGTGIVGYNVQTAVDTQHHLIVAHEVTNIGIDRDQLTPMAKQVRDAIGIQDLTVIADRGYFKSEQLLSCHEAGITALVPKCKTSSAKAAGRFDRADFIYNAENNEYRCPAGQHLIWRYSTVERKLKLHRYWSSNCQHCEIKAQCTPGEQRRITRWEHEDILDAMQTRLEQRPDSMRIRRQTVEHPFGTLKAWMGATHFLTKTLKNVSTEMSLHVLAYNMKRVMNILGPQAMIEAMRA